MRAALLTLFVPLALGGCLSFTSVPATPPAQTTLIVPPSSGQPPAVVCAPGMQPACQ